MREHQTGIYRARQVRTPKFAIIGYEAPVFGAGSLFMITPLIFGPSALFAKRRPQISPTMSGNIRYLAPTKRHCKPVTRS